MHLIADLFLSHGTASSKFPVNSRTTASIAKIIVWKYANINAFLVDFVKKETKDARCVLISLKIKGKIVHIQLKQVYFTRDFFKEFIVSKKNYCHLKKIYLLLYYFQIILLSFCRIFIIGILPHLLMFSLLRCISSCTRHVLAFLLYIHIYVEQKRNQINSKHICNISFINMNFASRFQLYVIYSYNNHINYIFFQLINLTDYYFIASIFIAFCHHKNFQILLFLFILIFFNQLPLILYFILITFCNAFD